MHARPRFRRVRGSGNLAGRKAEPFHESNAPSRGRLSKKSCMISRSYPTPEAFRQALEQRLRTVARTQGADISRLRQILIFGRFVARIFQELGDRAVATGGVVLELRVNRSRRNVRVSEDAYFTIAGSGAARELSCNLRAHGERRWFALETPRRTARCCAWTPRSYTRSPTRRLGS